MGRSWGLGFVFLALACSSNGSNLLDPFDASAPDAIESDQGNGGDAEAVDVVDASAMDAPSIDAPEVVTIDAPDVAPIDAPDVAPIDAPDVAPIDAPAADGADAASGCRTSDECPAGSLCSSLLRRCVECAADADCPVDRPLCGGGLCAPRVACTSSIMCPGGVCDPVARSCVRCAADVDCDPGQRCLAHACVADTACRSSAQCSQLGMVCDLAAGRCVDCVADVDCGAGAYCAAAGLCRPRVCAPSSVACADAMTVRTCDARGSSAVTAACAAGQSCVDGACVMRVCAPGAAECVDAARRRVCRADGFGFEAPASCAVGQSCAAGACVAQACAPGAGGGCADATSARVCAADGLGYGNVLCPSTPNAPGRCVGDRCALVCNSGFASCDAADGNGCEVNLLTATAHCGGCGRACAAGQACRNGACAAAGFCPASCGADLDCDPCRTSSDPDSVRYCCLSGLCISMTGVCPSVPPDAGLSDGSGVDSGGSTEAGTTDVGESGPG